MQFDSTFSLTEFGPWIYGKTEIYGSCTNQIQFAFEFEPFLGSEWLAVFEQGKEELFVELIWLLLISVHPETVID